MTAEPPPPRTADEPAPSGADRGPRRRGEPRADGYTEKASWGAISERHWTRTRAAHNREALEYYRRRSRAPGVAAGGAHRNYYCMKCDGVIPYYEEHERCPHCGEAIERTVRRYFNWVETDFPRRSDLRSLWPWALALAAAIAALGVLLFT
jgi:hypothetical protein